MMMNKKSQYLRRQIVRDIRRFQNFGQVNVEFNGSTSISDETMARDEKLFEDLDALGEKLRGGSASKKDKRNKESA